MKTFIGAFLKRSFGFFLSALLFFFGISSQSFAIKGACGDRHLPKNKIRKLRKRSIELRCSAVSEGYLRSSEPFDHYSWVRLEPDKVAMQKMRLKEPEITWSGAILYSTTEHWTWVDWVYGPDRSACGTTTHTTTHTRPDGSTYTTSYETVNSCWHDETQYESRHCSVERLEYSAKFLKPNNEKWKPGAKGYIDVIPNKYDLLPGEIENIEIISNSRHSSTLKPKVKVNDAWNDYDFDIEFVDSKKRSAPCRFNQSRKIEVEITTNKRLKKRPPNAFRFPTDSEGNIIEGKELSWWQSQGKKGLERVKPRAVRLEDVSYSMIRAMARQSRQNHALAAQRLEARALSGDAQNTSSKELDTHNESVGFWKKTEVRVRLWKPPTLDRLTPILWSKPIYTNASRSSRFENFKIKLDGNDETSDLYRGAGPSMFPVIVPSTFYEILGANLVPHSRYTIDVAMKQNGISFYKDKWSRPLEIPFETSSLDRRSGLEKFVDFQGGGLLKLDEFRRLFK